MKIALTQPKALIRTAAVLTVLFAGGHTSGFPWTPVVDSHTQPVIAAMHDVHFDVLGKLRSFEAFYLGFGISISIMQIALGCVIWLIASFADLKPGATRLILSIISLSFLAQAYLAWRYFFLPPLVFSVLVALLLLAAAARIRT
mgnify:CR=1 FL=1